MKALAELFLQEGRERLDELRPAGADDGAVARVGDNPEAGMRDGFGHFDLEFNWIPRIAVALNDERVGLNRGEKRRREIQVVVAGGEGLGADKDGFDLRVSAGMATLQDFPLLFGQIVSVLTHDGARLRRKVRSGADQHHGGDTIRLFRGHVEQNVAAGADSDCFAGANSEVIEQGKHVRGGVLVAERFRENA